MKTIFKIWAVLILLVAVGTQVQSAPTNPPKTFPMTENFEVGDFPPTGWALYDVDGLGSNWDLNEWINHTTDGYRSAFHGYAPGPQDGWFVAPQLSFPATGQIVLAFWSSIIDPGFYGKNSVMISTGSGDPASGDFVELWTPAQVTDGWRQVVLDLAAYAGQSVYIAFRYEGDYAHAWVIDDVYIGNDFDMSPVISVSPIALNAIGPINAVMNKTLTIANTGVNNLVYSMQVNYGGTPQGWLNLSPLAGNVAGAEQLAHSAVFSPTGLEIGVYTASIVIQSNDPQSAEITIPVTYEVVEASSVGVTVMIPEYTFPYDISENAEYVAISGFGAGGWLWSKTSGSIPILGEEVTVIAVSEQGKVAGSSRNPEYTIDGIPVMMAGYWSPQTEEWTYLPVNPNAGAPIYTDYTSSWGMTADGSVIVGLQYFEGYNYRSFKWTQSGGYEMIGDVLPEGNRPNGISNDGSVIFGWGNLPMASRSPVIWYNNEFIQIDPEEYGEATASSSDGQFVTGYAGIEGFLWSPQNGTTFFANTLNTGALSPIAVMDDGTVFGYTAEGWPPFPDLRRAFARLISGEMMTFNDYALGRGMADASDWIFYSINGVTPDGNKFIGAGITPEGQNVSFIIDFEAEIPSIIIQPLSLTEALTFGSSNTQPLTIQNTGTGSLDYNTYLHFLTSNTKGNSLQPVPVFDKKNQDFSANTFGSKKSTLQAKVKPQRTAKRVEALSPNVNAITSYEGSFGQTNAQAANTKAVNNNAKGSYELHYDGENIDAVGLVEGGSFSHAARFPQVIVEPFITATLSDVKIYILDAATSSKLYVWGPGTDGSPGDVIVEQNVTLTPNSWNTITLATPITLDGNDLWIGFNHTHDAGSFIAGIDGGPLNANGDFIEAPDGGWERLSDYGFTSNWNIRAILQLNDGTWLSLNPTSGTIEPESSENITVTFTGNVPAGNAYHANIIVTSNDVSNPLKYVPVTLEMLVGLNETQNDQMKIYPVPVQNELTIATDEGIHSICLINAIGQKVLETTFAGEKLVKVALSHLKTGVYTLQVIKSTQEIIFKPLIVN